MTEQDSIRINRFLSAAGVCSRREADRLIEEGRIFVNGRAAKTGMQIFPDDEVDFDKKVLSKKEERTLLLFNKPCGIVCTEEKREKNNIIDFINYPTRIFTIGRLDKDSHGLILLTDDGSIVNDIMKGSRKHEKEYHVRVDKPLTEGFIKRMKEGVYLPELSVKTRKCKVKRTGEMSFDITLTQGLNRQIRRMCEALGYKVLDLMRFRIMNLFVDNIREGSYRRITPEEERELFKELYNADQDSK